MNRTLLAAALMSITGFAAAQEPLAPVVVEGVDGRYIVERCTPPTAAPECAPFHQMIRDNFSDREIAMLFGAATAAPERSASYSQVRERYDNLVAFVAEHGVPRGPWCDEVELCSRDTPCAVTELASRRAAHRPSNWVPRCLLQRRLR